MAKTILTFNVLAAVIVMCIMVFFFYNLQRAQDTINRIPCEEAIAEQGEKINRLTSQLSDSNNKLNQLVKITESIQKTQRAQQSQQPPPISAQPPADQKPPLDTDKQTKDDSQPLPTPAPTPPRIPVVVISCNRAEYLRKTLNTLVERRPSKDFPIIISQDCDNADVDNLLWNEFEEVVTVLRHHKTAAPPPGSKQMQSYSYIARHYQWMFTQIFDKLSYDAVIVIEDDMEIAVDFFELFLGTYPIMKADPTIYCVSSWNDNGLTKFVKDPEQLYRTDVFPGLGWMLTKEIWDDIKAGWPDNFWDEYMRSPTTRKQRVCIRPEIVRNFNFGKAGTSEGEFWSTHIQHIKPTTEFVKFTDMNLSYLIKDNYDEWFFGLVKNAQIKTPKEVTHQDLEAGDYRVIYNDIPHYKTLANHFGLMPDEKEGMPRTSYHMIVPFHLGDKRVFLTPPHLDFEL